MTKYGEKRHTCCFFLFCVWHQTHHSNVIIWNDIPYITWKIVAVKTVGPNVPKCISGTCTKKHGSGHISGVLCGRIPYFCTIWLHFLQTQFIKNKVCCIVYWVPGALLKLIISDFRYARTVAALKNDPLLYALAYHWQAPFTLLYRTTLFSSLYCWAIKIQ